MLIIIIINVKSNVNVLAKCFYKCLGLLLLLVAEGELILVDH